MAMWFQQVFDPESRSYSYLIGDERVAAVIDPVFERVDALCALLASRRLLWALETHVHADHVTGSAVLRARAGCQIAVPRLANSCQCADRSLVEGDEIPVGALRLRVIETPGHTPESVSYYVEAEKMLFTGDALLVGTCGRTDFQGGDPGALYDSLHLKLFALPETVAVYPGHDYRGQTQTAIGVEKRGNQRAAGRTRDEFITLMNSLDLAPPEKMAEAIPANQRCGSPHEA